MSGADLTQIPSIDDMTAQSIISESGVPLSKFKTEKQFSSWLGLCPNNNITGGFVKRSSSLNVTNRTANALRRVAPPLTYSNSSLRAYYRRLTSRLGVSATITASAHKLANIVCRLVKTGEHYIDVGLAYYERNYK